MTYKLFSRLSCVHRSHRPMVAYQYGTRRMVFVPWRGHYVFARFYL